MIKTLALWALAVLRKRIRMSGEQSLMWDKFVQFLTEMF